MRSATAPFLIILVCACLLSTGCVLYRADENSPSPCGSQDPIVGAWTYDPTGNSGASSEAVYLYIFKESGRFDAAAMPRDPTHPLTYENWSSGSWQPSGREAYTLNGEIIRHDFSTDSHETRSYAQRLRYDDARDVLYAREPPGGMFTRFSCEPQVPPGMNVTIPWD